MAMTTSRSRLYDRSCGLELALDVATGSPGPPLASLASLSSLPPNPTPPRPSSRSHFRPSLCHPSSFLSSPSLSFPPYPSSTLPSHRPALESLSFSSQSAVRSPALLPAPSSQLPALNPSPPLPQPLPSLAPSYSLLPPLLPLGRSRQPTSNHSQARQDGCLRVSRRALKQKAVRRGALGNWGIECLVYLSFCRRMLTVCLPLPCHCARPPPGSFLVEVSTADRGSERKAGLRAGTARH